MGPPVFFTAESAPFRDQHKYQMIIPTHTFPLLCAYHQSQCFFVFFRWVVTKRKCFNIKEIRKPTRFQMHLLTTQTRHHRPQRIHQTASHASCLSFPAEVTHSGRDEPTFNVVPLMDTCKSFSDPQTAALDHFIFTQQLSCFHRFVALLKGVAVCLNMLRVRGSISMCLLVISLVSLLLLRS